jgi:hypothetical protein
VDSARERLEAHARMGQALRMAAWGRAHWADATTNRARSRGCQASSHCLPIVQGQLNPHRPRPRPDLDTQQRTNVTEPQPHRAPDGPHLPEGLDRQQRLSVRARDEPVVALELDVRYLCVTDGTRDRQNSEATVRQSQSSSSSAVGDGGAGLGGGGQASRLTRSTPPAVSPLAAPEVRCVCSCSL